MKLGSMFGGKTPLANRTPEKVEQKPKQVQRKDLSRIPVEWPVVRTQGPKDYKVITTGEQLVAYLQRCEQTGMCGFDYETAPDLDERDRWSSTKFAYHMRIKAYEEEPKTLKLLESELIQKYKDHLESPFDPWCADVCTISLSAAPDEARVVYISHRKGNKNFNGTREQIFDILDKHLFNNQKIIKIAVNLSFETKFTTKQEKYIMSPVADPFLMWVRCLQVCKPESIKDRKKPSSGKGLKPMTKEVFGVDMNEFTAVLSKHNCDFFDEMDTDHRDTLMYSAEDADYAVQHYLYWIEVAKQIPGYFDWLHNIEMPFARVIGLMEYWGMPWDAELAKSKRIEAEQAIEQITTEIEQLARDTFGMELKAGKSGKTGAVKDLIFNKMQLPVAKTSDTTGDASLDKESLIDMIFLLENHLNDLEEEVFLGVKIPDDHSQLNFQQRKALEVRNRPQHPYKDQGIQLLRLLQKIAKYSTLLSSHIIGREKYVHPVSGRIHAGYSQWTETGRLNSFSPNNQNTPKPVTDVFGVRNFHRAPKGKTLVLADESGFELRLMAWKSQDKVMINIFNHGGDMHKTTAAELTGKLYDDVTKLDRQNAKAANFGISYGGTEYALQATYKKDYDMRKTLEECRAAIDAVKRAYPGIPQYQTDIVLWSRERGYVETIFGYKRMLPDINSSNNFLRGQDERRAANTPIQGSAADIMKRCQNEVYEEIGKGTYKFYWEHIESPFRHGKADMCLQVHDELGLEVANEKWRVLAVGKRIKEIMEQEPLPGFPVKLVSDVSVVPTGKGWGEKIDISEWERGVEQ